MRKRWTISKVDDQSEHVQGRRPKTACHNRTQRAHALAQTIQVLVRVLRDGKMCELAFRSVVTDADSTALPHFAIDDALRNGCPQPHTFTAQRGRRLQGVPPK